MDTADWSSVGTFRKFYLGGRDGDRVQSAQSFTTAVLQTASNSHCDIEPEPSNVQS